MRETERIRALKEQMQDDLKARESFDRRLAALERGKEAEIAALARKAGFAALDAKTRREHPEYKQAAQAISDQYAKELDTLRTGMEERYAESRKKNLPDYDIFMAIAEDIGYDATGKKTQTNELDAIGEALARFIQDSEGERI